MTHVSLHRTLLSCQQMRACMCRLHVAGTSNCAAEQQQNVAPHACYHALEQLGGVWQTDVYGRAEQTGAKQTYKKWVDHEVLA